MTALILFIGLQLVNVMLNTFKSIALATSTNKMLNAIINAVTFGFYALVVKQFMEFDSFTVVWVTVVTNLIGVYISMLIVEKAHKDKLWRIEMTVKIKLTDDLCRQLKLNELEYNYYEMNDRNALITVYCHTQAESTIVKGIVEKYQIKTYNVLEVAKSL